MDKVKTIEKLKISRFSKSTFFKTTRTLGLETLGHLVIPPYKYVTKILGALKEVIFQNDYFWIFDLRNAQMLNLVTFVT